MYIHKKKKRDDADDAGNVDLLEQYINDNRWSERTMKDPSFMFFFSAQEKENRIVVGIGSEKDTFNSDKILIIIDLILYLNLLSSHTATLLKSVIQ